MNKKLKIAWFGKKSPFCGNVTYSREITNLLTNKGHEVIFFHFEDENKDENEKNADKDIKIPCLYKSQIYTIPSMKSAKVVTNALREIKPDIVHASLSISPIDFRLPEICHELGIPIVSTFHNAFDKRPTFHGSTAFLVYQLYAPSLAQYDGVIIFSEMQKNLLEKLGVSSDKIKVIPNGVDINKFTPGVSEFKKQYPGKLIFTYMGRINPEKGVEDLLKAFTRTPLENCMLVIMGGGSQDKVLKAIYGEEKNIIWTGVIKEEQKRIDILRGSDAFILPSQIEGLSLSLLEAMACAAPIIATEVGSDGEVLSDGAGIIIDPMKVKSHLSFALKLIRDNTDLRELLSGKARERAVERYSIEKNVESVEALYYECIEKNLKKAPVFTYT